MIKKLGPSSQSVLQKRYELLLSHWGFIGEFIGPWKQQLFHCNKCVHNCGVAYHMTIFQFMNPSDANGKHLNLSESNCMHGCQIGSAAVITLPYDI